MVGYSKHFKALNFLFIPANPYSILYAYLTYIVNKNDVKCTQNLSEVQFNVLRRNPSNLIIAHQ